MVLAVSPNHSVDKNPPIYTAYTHISRLQWTSTDTTSLSDAERTEDRAEQVVRRIRTRDLTQGLLRVTQLFRSEFPSVRAVQRVGRS